MKISKAVYLFMEFVELNSETKIEIDHENFLNNLETDLKKFLNKKHRNFEDFSIKFCLADKQGFFEVDTEAETLGEAFSISKHFSDYVVEQEKGFTKFLYGLIGSGLAVFGGLIGALITALVQMPG